ncbi:MAG: SDR family oxidoreductase [Anaerolineae bacterium]|nr:SDR family oxidoreductase [Anaerolineae bacterium]
MSDLKGKVALITGAGRLNGIGAASAMILAQAGANVAVSDLCAAPSNLPHGGNPNWDELVTVADRIAEHGVKSLPVKADVTDKQQVDAMVQAVMERFGRIDILVNNAGVIIMPLPVLQLPEDVWRKTLDINATGTFLCCQAVLPGMIERVFGRIVNMASIAAVRPRIFMSAYAASKAAVIALTQSLAQEVGEFGITVNAILPGDIDTGMKQWGMQFESTMTGKQYADVVGDLESRIPVGRIGTPQDVAQLVAFLVSDSAEFITGQAYNLTGGRELT